MTTDKERITNLLTALETALDIAKSNVKQMPNSWVKTRDLGAIEIMEQFAKFEREKESEAK